MSLARRLWSWHAPGWLGPTMLFVVSGLGLFAVFWGYFNPPDIQVVMFDAGDANRFAVHRVVAYRDRDLYLVRLEDGRIRAIDGRVVASGCRVEWLPDDPRGGERNPQGLPGVYRDPCSGALWSFEGNAISGITVPLRTPQVTTATGTDGVQRVVVELVNPSK